jgi:hypothetical protein
MPPLGCFQPSEVPPAGAIGRLFGRKPRRSCFIHIQNLLATRDLSTIVAADVENVTADTNRK